MIALPTSADECYKAFLHQAVMFPRGRRVSIVLAAHAPIAHILGAPCIYLARKLKYHRYPLVHERNVVRILKHENLHHVLFDILGDKDGLDNMFPNLEDLP